MKLGTKIKFKEEKQRYTVQACDDRYVIATKPMNALKTYLYTILDLKKKIRGRSNLIFDFNEYNNLKGASEALEMLNSNEMDISHRNAIPLNIEEITHREMTATEVKKRYVTKEQLELEELAKQLGLNDE